MHCINFIKSKSTSKVHNILRWIFILCGGHFYLNYILITNNKSKNPLIKFLWKRFKNNYTPKSRLKFAYTAGLIHVGFAIGHIYTKSFFSLGNFLVNIYPIIVQLYMGYRCYRILKLRKKVK